MTIRAAVKQYLGAQATLASLVADRIFPVARPQSSPLPAVVFKRLNGAHAHWITGGAGRADPRFLIDCIADTYSDADTLAEAVRAVMQGFSGDVGGVLITSVVLDDEADDIDEPQEGNDRVAFHIPLIFKIQYRESIPTP